MYDKELVRDILSQILDAAQIVITRFKPVKSFRDFSKSPKGREKLDAICMQLIAIGESLKNIGMKFSQSKWHGGGDEVDVVSPFSQQLPQLRCDNPRSAQRRITGDPDVQRVTPPFVTSWQAHRAQR